MTSQHDADAQVVDHRWLTVEEAARRSGRSASYVRRLARDGGLVAQRDGRRWMVSAESIDALWGSSRVVEPESWDLERRLLYAERAELQLALQTERAERLEAENRSLRIENDRLRAALVALAGGAASDVAPQAR